MQTQLTNRSSITIQHEMMIKLTISHKLLKTRKLSQFSPTRQNQAIPFWSEKFLNVFGSGQSDVSTGFNDHVLREERESSHWPLPSPRSVDSLETLGDVLSQNVQPHVSNYHTKIILNLCQCKISSGAFYLSKEAHNHVRPIHFSKTNLNSGSV